MDAPLIAVTMGDPAGIGPEIIARTFAEEGFRNDSRAFVVGDPAMLGRAARLLDLTRERGTPPSATSRRRPGWPRAAAWQPLPPLH